MLLPWMWKIGSQILDCPQMPLPGQYGQLNPGLSGYTQLVLEALARHDVKATFFILGWVAGNTPAIGAEYCLRLGMRLRYLEYATCSRIRFDRRGT